VLEVITDIPNAPLAAIAFRSAWMPEPRKAACPYFLYGKKTEKVPGTVFCPLAEQTQPHECPHFLEFVAELIPHLWSS